MMYLGREQSLETGTPEYWRFRSRCEANKYLEDNPTEGVTVDLAVGAKKIMLLARKQMNEFKKFVVEDNQEFVTEEVAIEDLKKKV